MAMNEETPPTPTQVYLASEMSNMSITEEVVADNMDLERTASRPIPNHEQLLPNHESQSQRPGCTMLILNQLLSSLKASRDPTDSRTTSNLSGEVATISGYKFEDHYRKCTPIGTGAYGRVFACRHLTDPLDLPVKYAVKELCRDRMKAKDIDSVIREVSILRELSQSQFTDSSDRNIASTASHVIQLIDFFVNVDKLYVVQVYAAGGDVFDRLTQRKHYTEWDARVLAKDLLQAVYMMHTNRSPSPIVHRDLKPENLLLLDEFSDTQVVVADFGFARHVDADGFCSTRCGTPSYVSPELLLGHRYNESVDIWSVGCIIYMLLVGYLPFPAHRSDHRALFRAIRAGDYVFHDEQWANVSIHAKQLIPRLLCVNASKRYTAKEALDSPWFTSVTAEQLQQRDLSKSIDTLKKFDPANAWKRAVNALGFCATASFWQPDVISFGQQLELWDTGTDGSVASSGTQQQKIYFADMYELTREVRKGKSGTVWECRHRSTKEIFAVKIIPRTSKAAHDEFALNEVAIMQSLAGRECVVQLLDFYEEKESFYLVMQFCMGGDLFDRVLRFTHYTESDAKDITAQLLMAIRSIHNAGIAHRDIKPQNVLLLSEDDNINMRIADFGYSRRVHTPESLTDRAGTPSYVAPEILRNLPHDQRVDLWSLGVVVFVLLVGYPPFLESDPTTLFHKIRNGEWSFVKDDWKCVSPEAKQFVQGLLVVDPLERWTIDECLRSSWIKQDPSLLSSIDLSAVISKLKTKKLSLRSIARSVIVFHDGIRIVHEDLEQSRMHDD